MTIAIRKLTQSWPRRTRIQWELHKRRRQAVPRWCCELRCSSEARSQRICPARNITTAYN